MSQYDRVFKKLQESWKAVEEEEQKLDELLMHGDTKSGINVVAYKQHLWVLPEEVPKDTANEIASFLLPDKYEDEQAFDDGAPSEIGVHDVTQLIRDEDRADILTGYLRDGELVLTDSGGGFKMDPKSSLLVKKVAQALKVKKVSYQDDLEGDMNVSVPKKKMTAQIPDIAYHGTSLKYLEDILKRGLEPRGDQSNYDKQGIYHDDKIFFSTRFGEASHHAQHTGSKTKNLPMVLELFIPDKNLVIPDYDVDMHGGETTYDAPNRKTHTKFGSDKSYSLSKEFGVYGYAGKILPQHIKFVYVLFDEENYNPSIKNYKKFNPAKLKKFLDKHGSFDELMYFVK